MTIGAGSDEEDAVRVVGRSCARYLNMVKLHAGNHAVTANGAVGLLMFNTSVRICFYLILKFISHGLVVGVLLFIAARLQLCVVA